jgi:hypothetical protein
MLTVYQVVCVIRTPSMDSLIATIATKKVSLIIEMSDEWFTRFTFLNVIEYWLTILTS